MDELPSVIPKSIIEAMNNLESDEDNRFSWKLSRSLDSLSLTVSCKRVAKTSNKAKDGSEVTGHVTVNPVKRRRKKKSPSALVCSKERLARFLEKKSAGKPDLASPEDKRITAVPCEQDSCAKELENTSLGIRKSLDLTCGTSDTDLLAQEQEILREFLDTTDIDLDSDDDVSRIISANVNQKKERTLNIARAVRLHSTVVLIGRENTGISIDSHVRLWPRSRPQRKLNLSATVQLRTCCT